MAVMTGDEMQNEIGVLIAPMLRTSMQSSKTATAT
jgi:hypothetical protein